MSNNLRSQIDIQRMTRYQWSVVILCMVLNMIDGFDVLVMAFTASAVSAHWKLNATELGVLLSAGAVGMAIGSLFLAPWADKIGRRPLTLLSLLISGVSMTVAYWAQNPTQLALLRGITGIGVGGILACSNVLASEYASTRWRSLAVTLQSTGYALGAAIGGSIAVWLLRHYDWHTVFLFGGIWSLAVLVVCWFMLPESMDFLLERQPENALARTNALARKLELPQLAALPAVNPNAPKKQAGIRRLLAPDLLRPTLLVWISFFAVMFGFYFVMSWTPKLLAATGMTPEQGVTAGVLLSLGGIIGATLLGLLAARFAVNKALACFMVITAVLLCFIVSNPGSLPISYSLAFLIGVFVNGCVAGLYAIAPRVYDSSVRATGVGWGIGIGRIGTIVSPLVAGALLDAQWKPATLYIAFGLTFVFAAIIVLMHRLKATPAGAAGTLSAH